jgi:sigma-E factor negative regulatory protein RseA
MKPPPRPDLSPPDEPSADDPRRWLSALADGEAEAAAPACRWWRDDEAARRTWHAYHLIGDVLRSSELAATPARDAAFLAGLREKRAAEPVVLAPAPAAAPRRRQAWLMPAAAAAGFVVVAGTLVVTRMVTPGAPVPAAVMAGASGAGLTAVSSAAPAAAVRPSATVFIRDPRLDEYLRAHQSARGGVAAASPGGTLRHVDAVAPAGGQR